MMVYDAREINRYPLIQLVRDHRPGSAEDDQTGSARGRSWQVHSVGRVSVYARGS